jgi:predicted transcriptional regulator
MVLEMEQSLRAKIFSIIKANWPIHVSGICRILELDTSTKNIARVLYHIKCLENDGKIMTKRIDRATVCWPSMIEKLRVVHELMGENE